MLQLLWLTGLMREKHPGLLNTATQNKHIGLISIEMTESRKEARLYPEISIYLCVLVGRSADLFWTLVGYLKGGFTKKIESTSA